MHKIKLLVLFKLTVHSRRLRAFLQSPYEDTYGCEMENIMAVNFKIKKITLAIL